MLHTGIRNPIKSLKRWKNLQKNTFSTTYLKVKSNVLLTEKLKCLAEDCG